MARPPPNAVRLLRRYRPFSLSAPLLRLKADLLHDGRLAHDVLPDELGELLRRTADWDQAVVREVFLRFRQRERLYHFTVDAADDFHRRTRGKPDAVVTRHVESGQARFLERRDIGHLRLAARAADAERAQPPGLNIRHRGRRACHHGFDMPAEYVVKRNCRALVRYVQEVN